MDIRINVKEIIDSSNAISYKKGELLNTTIASSVNRKEVVILDFSGITAITSSFLNIALGSLYKIASPEVLTQLVKIDPNTVEPYQLSKIAAVLKNAKQKIWENIDDGEIK